MAHLDSKCPERETARAISIEDSDRVGSLFKNGEWKIFKKSGIIKLRYYNPNETMFRHMSVSENVFNDRKVKQEEINRFRNCDLTQHSTSVDFEEIVRSGGYIVKILERFICDKLEFNPLERFTIDMMNKRGNFKEENKSLLQALTEKFLIQYMVVV